MAGDWLKFEKATPDKPEVFAIAAAMNCDPDAVVGKLIRVWSWFDTHTVDGNGLGVTPALLDRIAGVSGFVVAMAGVDWLIISDDGVSLPNFNRHTGETAKGRALTAKRVAGHKDRCNAKANAVSVSAALPREEKRREEVHQEQARSKDGASASGRRLPADWTLPADWREWAKAERPEIDPAAEAAKFADYWHALPGAKGRKTDWLKTWRNWIRSAYGPRAGPAVIAGKPSAAADFRGKTYESTPIDQLPPDLRAAAERAMQDD